MDPFDSRRFSSRTMQMALMFRIQETCFDSLSLYQPRVLPELTCRVKTRGSQINHFAVRKGSIELRSWELSLVESSRSDTICIHVLS